MLLPRRNNMQSHEMLRKSASNRYHKVLDSCKRRVPADTGPSPNWLDKIVCKT